MEYRVLTSSLYRTDAHHTHQLGAAGLGQQPIGASSAPHLPQVLRTGPVAPPAKDRHPPIAHHSSCHPGPRSSTLTTPTTTTSSKQFLSAAVPDLLPLLAPRHCLPENTTTVFAPSPRHLSQSAHLVLRTEECPSLKRNRDRDSAPPPLDNSSSPRPG